jgi:hypothetical protein
VFFQKKLNILSKSILKACTFFITPNPDLPTSWRMMFVMQPKQYAHKDCPVAITLSFHLQPVTNANRVQEKNSLLVQATGGGKSLFMAKLSTPELLAINTVGFFFAITFLTMIILANVAFYLSKFKM